MKKHNFDKLVQNIICSLGYHDWYDWYSKEKVGTSGKKGDPCLWRHADCECLKCGRFIVIMT